MGHNASTDVGGEHPLGAPAAGAIAFFDVDGTLTTVSTMHRFLRYYVTRLGRPAAEYLGWASTAAAMSRQGHPREQINERYFRHFAGADANVVAGLAAEWLAAELRTGGFYHEPVLAELRRHQAAGDRVVLVSGALAACLDVLAADLGADEICCATPEIIDGRYTGTLAGPPMIGAAKAVAAAAVIARYGVAGSGCAAYGDHVSDLPMMRLTGWPAAVDADRELSAVARANGWRILAAPGPAAERPLPVPVTPASTPASPMTQSPDSGGRMTEWFFQRMHGFGASDAIVHDGRTWTYSDLLTMIESWRADLYRRDVRPGQVVVLEGPSSVEACAGLLALVATGAIVVPLTRLPAAKRAEFHEIAQVETVITVEPGRGRVYRNTGRIADHPLYDRLRDDEVPGLVLFSSGTTGRSKATVLDFSRALAKYGEVRKAMRTLGFLNLDHIGGINTLLHTLSQGGAIVTLPDRSPDAVCAAIAAHRVEVLPTTPTFLNMLLISGAYQRHDLSGLRLITYGTEPMPL
ncbi:MAG: HAD-IB family hydrolase, partial [Catenulispora sp.]|nr:HAD-IB family hydrolase [Catenulispora sp.]